MHMNHRSIPCNFDPNTHVLTPSMSPDNAMINAVINTQSDDMGGRGGTLSFSGGVKAFLTMDDSGRIIGYSLTDHNDNIQQSVENILGFNRA